MAFDAGVSEEDKTSKLLRSLPALFAPLAILSSTQKLSFNRVITAEQAKIARRSIPNTPEASDGHRDEVKANLANAGRRNSR